MKEFLEYVARTIGITRMEDWYQVTANQISKLGGNIYTNISICLPISIIAIAFIHL